MGKDNPFDVPPLSSDAPKVHKVLPGDPEYGVQMFSVTIPTYITSWELVALDKKNELVILTCKTSDKLKQQYEQLLKENKIVGLVRVRHTYTSTFLVPIERVLDNLPMLEFKVE